MKYSNIPNFSDLNESLNLGYQQFQRGMGGLNTGVTQQDRDLVQQGVGGATDIVMRQLMERLPQLQGAMQGQMGARGIGGSGVEGIQAGLIGQQGVQSLQDILSQQQQLGSQYLMQVPMQRAQFGLQRNQALFNNLIASLQPQYDSRMQTAQMRQQQKMAHQQSWMGAIGGIAQGAGQLLPLLFPPAAPVMMAGQVATKLAQ